MHTAETKCSERSYRLHRLNATYNVLSSVMTRSAKAFAATKLLEPIGRPTYTPQKTSNINYYVRDMIQG